MVIDSMVELERRLDALTERTGRCILGLAGPPGCGKSTLAQQIAARLPEQAAIVPMDGFHLANTELARLGLRETKGAPDTFDSAGYVALLARLHDPRPDRIVYAPEFRREIEEPVAGAIAVTSAHRLVITEGNYLLLTTGHWRDVRALIDHIWYIDIDTNVRVERLIARHVRFGRDPQAARAWVMRSDERNAALIATTRDRADAIVRFAS